MTTAVWTLSPSGERMPVEVLSVSRLGEHLVRLPSGEIRYTPPGSLTEIDGALPKETTTSIEAAISTLREPSAIIDTRFPICACGCGRQTRGGKRLPGHNMRDGSARATRESKS